MKKLKVLDLFSGIGGFSLGLERAGMETVAFCEIEEYPVKVLNKHWPNVPVYEDVRNVTKERLEADGIRPNIICGGFPCQDISIAGNQAGIYDGERSSLWGELCRIIGEIRPNYAIVENVTALISGDKGRWFQRVLRDLAEIGYDCEWHCISASELGAHHHRDRIWIICYPKYAGRATTEIRESDQKGNGSHSEGSKPASKSKGSGNAEILADTNSTQFKRGCISEQIQQEYPNIISSGWWISEPSVGRVANGVSRRVDRLKGLGNAVVPQVVELIGRAIISTYDK